MRSTAEEILVDILLRLLSPEIISRNGGNIPLNDYALKVYGSDEFLVPTAEIGKHPFVGHYLSQGKDVELEVGKRVISLAAECNRKLEKWGKDSFNNDFYRFNLESIFQYSQY